MALGREVFFSSKFFWDIFLVVFLNPPCRETPKNAIKKTENKAHGLFVDMGSVSKPSSTGGNQQSACIFFGHRIFTGFFLMVFLMVFLTPLNKKHIKAQQKCEIYILNCT
jgi:hypothetical protein